MPVQPRVTSADSPLITENGVFIGVFCSGFCCLFVWVKLQSIHLSLMMENTMVWLEMLSSINVVVSFCCFCQEVENQRFSWVLTMEKPALFICFSTLTFVIKD